MSSTVNRSLVEIKAMLYKKGEKLSVHDEPAVAITVEPHSDPRFARDFANWEDCVGDVVKAEARKTEVQIPEDDVVDALDVDDVLAGMEESEPRYDYFPVLEDFWAIHVSYVDEVVGTMGATSACEYELDVTSWDDILDAEAIRREIDELSAVCKAGWEEKRAVLGEAPGDNPQMPRRVQYVALVEFSFSVSTGLDGTDYDSSCDYLGRLDPKRFHLARPETTSAAEVKT
jgi:hypothetical protein